MKNEDQNSAQNEWESLFEDGAYIPDIRYDAVFKAVFTKDTEKSRGALSSLVSALIGRNVMVETIIANEPPTGFIGQKKIRYDIACVSKNGEPIDVEMSFHPIDDELNKLEYYASRLLVGQDIEGVDKTYSDLKETYQIAILAQKVFFPDKHLTHTFQYYDPQACVSLDGKIRIITLELEKASSFIDKPAAEMSGAELWAVYFQYLTNEAKREKIKEIIDREEGIAMAIKAMKLVASTFEEYALETSLLKGELDWRSGMKDAERRGRNEEKLENARKMKAMNFSAEQIQAVTALSAETIANL